MLFLSPLEQFEIQILRPFVLNPINNYIIDISITNVAIFLFFANILTIIFLFFGLYKPTLIPNRLQFLVEAIIHFILNILKQQAGANAVKYLPLFLTIFFLILTSNLFGLFPFAVTPTSHLILTFTLAFSCNLAFIIIGFYEHGFRFLKVFVPKGGPRWLLPLIVVIEFISYLLRTFSLSIRLFANMMAGHTLLHILSSFITAFLNSGFLFFSFFPFVLVVAIVILEFGIAFLQAYVFIILLSIYLNDSFHPSH